MRHAHDQPASVVSGRLRTPSLANISRKRFTEAEAMFARQSKSLRKVPFGYVKMEKLKIVQHQFSEAAQAYQTAFDQKPEIHRCLRGLMNSYMAQKQLDRPLAIAEAQIAKVRTTEPSTFARLCASTDNMICLRRKLPSQSPQELERETRIHLIKLLKFRPHKVRLRSRSPHANRGFKLIRTRDLYSYGESYQSKRDRPMPAIRMGRS